MCVCVCVCLCVCVRGTAMCVCVSQTDGLTSHYLRASFSILKTLILVLKKQVDEMGSSGTAALINPALTLAVLFEEFVTGGYMIDLPSATANQLVDLSLDPKRCTPEVSTACRACTIGTVCGSACSACGACTIGTVCGSACSACGACTISTVCGSTCSVCGACTVLQSNMVSKYLERHTESVLIRGACYQYWLP